MENFSQSGAESQRLFLITSRAGVASAGQLGAGCLSLCLTLSARMWPVVDEELKKKNSKVFPSINLWEYLTFSLLVTKTSKQTSFILKASGFSKGDLDQVENLQSNNQCWNLPLSDTIPYSLYKWLHLRLVEMHSWGSQASSCAAKKFVFDTGSQLGAELSLYGMKFHPGKPLQRV